VAVDGSAHERVAAKGADDTAQTAHFCFALSTCFSPLANAWLVGHASPRPMQEGMAAESASPACSVAPPPP
jgi:hypothetical protein